MCSTGQAGGAAAAPFIIFSNMTPNTTVSIDNCVITNTGAAADIYNVQLLRGLAFGGGTVGVVLNQTSPLNVPPNLRQQRGTGAFGGSPTQLYFVNLAPLISTPVFPLGIVLYPNDSLAFFTGTAAVGSQIQVTAWGREFLAG
jgi:hypothetical protein